jgi:hypothetical protein
MTHSFYFSPGQQSVHQYGGFRLFVVREVLSEFWGVHKN